MITLPQNHQHITDAVLCVARIGIKVQTKRGGRSYASFSSEGQNGSLIVSLESFQTLFVDGADVATVEEGVSWEIWRWDCSNRVGGRCRMGYVVGLV